MEQDIRIDTIHFDRVALREDVTIESVHTLAEDIKMRGLLQAIVVRPRQGGGYRLVAGRRRLTAAKSLDWITIPARILDEGDIDEIDALAENLMRLQMNPLEEAMAVKMLHEDKGLSIAQIREQTNHGTSWVQDRLMLANMPELFQKAVAKRKVSISAAALLLQIEDTEYRDYLLKIAEINGATVNQVEAWLMDYEARRRLIDPTGEGLSIPHPPYPPSDPPVICTLCDQQTPHSTSTLIRACPECHGAVAAALTHSTRFEPDSSPQSVKSETY